MMSQMNPLTVVSEIKSGMRGGTETGFAEEAAFHRRRVVVERNRHCSHTTNRQPDWYSVLLLSDNELLGFQITFFDFP